MERKILHIDVNNAFLSWLAVYKLQNGETLEDILENSNDENYSLKDLEQFLEDIYHHFLNFCQQSLFEKIHILKLVQIIDKNYHRLFQC